MRDRTGNPVMMSTSARGPSLAAESAEQAAGSHHVQCVIPANLLNEGRYSITVTVGRGINQPFATAEDCLTFDVHDTSEQRGLYAGNWPGVVRPKLVWRKVPSSSL